MAPAAAAGAVDSGDGGGRGSGIIQAELLALSVAMESTVDTAALVSNPVLYTWVATARMGNLGPTHRCRTFENDKRRDRVENPVGPPPVRIPLSSASLSGAPTGWRAGG